MHYSKVMYASPPAGYGKSLRQHVVRKSRRDTLQARPAVAASAAAAAAAAASRVPRCAATAPLRGVTVLPRVAVEAPATALTRAVLGASSVAADPADTSNVADQGVCAAVWHCAASH